MVGETAHLHRLRMDGTLERSVPAAATTTSGSTALIQTATVNGKSETVPPIGPRRQSALAGVRKYGPRCLPRGQVPPGSAESLPGALSVPTTAKGTQVAYNGHPLYTYTGDSGPAQSNGEGIGGIWHVVTPALS